MEANEDIPFVSLIQDDVFKTIWQCNNTDVIKFMKRVVSNIVHYDITDFNLFTNELPIQSKKSIKNRIDVFLESPDKLKKINVEVNCIRSFTMRNKNNSYIFKIAGDFYASRSDTKYLDNIDVTQVNLNGFYNKNRSVRKSEFVLYDKENDCSLDDIKIIDVYLPTYNELCYNEINEDNLDLAMFTCTSFEQMEGYIKGNKERRAVMEELKRLSVDKDVPTYNYQEYLNALHTELDEERRRREARAFDKGKKQGFELGEKNGIKQGIKHERKNIIDKLLKFGMSQEDIDKALNT